MILLPDYMSHFQKQYDHNTQTRQCRGLQRFPSSDTVPISQEVCLQSAVSVLLIITASGGMDVRTSLHMLYKHQREKSGTGPFPQTYDFCLREMKRWCNIKTLLGRALANIVGNLALCANAELVVERL